jgi:hypothetical protein
MTNCRPSMLDLLRSRRAAPLAVLGMAILLPATAAAHRLDEYLQTTRLALAPDGVVVALDLTPGGDVVSGVLAPIDCDGDRRLSSVEGRSYAGSARCVSWRAQERASGWPADTRSCSRTIIGATWRCIW